MAEMMTPSGPMQDDGAIAAIILYTCAECARRTHSLEIFGINEALFAVDRDHYLATGKPLTGFRYMKSPFGFFAEGLELHVARLIAAGKLTETRRGDGDECFIYYSADPDWRFEVARLLQGVRLQALDRVIDEIVTLGSREIIRLLYSAPEWKICDHGEYVPWERLSVPGLHSNASVAPYLA